MTKSGVHSGPLDDLISRLEAASGPAIVFDAELFWLFDRQRATTAFWRGSMGLPKPLPDDFSRLPRGLGVASLEASAPNYTASVDAALDLVDRVLPDHGPIDLMIMGSAKVTIWSNEPCGRDLSDAFGNTPALALCIAVLKLVKFQWETKPAGEGKT